VCDLFNEAVAEVRTTDDSSLQLEAKLRTKLRAVEIGLRVIEIRNLEGRITALEEQSKRTYTDGELTVSNGIILRGAIQVNTVVDDNLVEPFTRALANGLAGKRHTILRLPVDSICVAAPLEASALASGG